MQSQRICDGALLWILLCTSVEAKRRHPTAILPSDSHSLALSLFWAFSLSLSLCLSLSVFLRVSFAPCQRITFFLSRLPSWVFWCYFSSLASLPTNCCPQQAQSTSFVPVCPHTAPHPCVFSLDRKTVVRRKKNMSRKKKKTLLLPALDHTGLFFK